MSVIVEIWQTWGRMRTLGDFWGAVAGLNQDIASLWSEGGGNGLCESLNTVQERCASINTELKLLYDVSIRAQFVCRIAAHWSYAKLSFPPSLLPPTYLVQ